MKITTIMINATDIEKLAEFWKALLDVEEDSRSGSYIWLKPMRDSLITIGFQKVKNTESNSSNVHFDIQVNDKDKTTDNVKRLGGALIHEGKINNIVSDPSGNQFCVYVLGDQK